MKLDYLVSICVPVYGVERYIERCARSILEQSYENLEVIFVNDASKDCSVEILERVIAEYPSRRGRVVALTHESNRGLAAARNTGVDHAQGEFVMHVDSDDWIERDAVERLVRRQQETEADIVSGNAITHYNGYDQEMIEPDYADKNEMIQNVIGLTLDHVIWRRLIRRTLYVNNNISAVEGVNIGEDHYTLPQLVYYARSIAKVDYSFYHYNCTNPSSYTYSKCFEKDQEVISSNLKSLGILMDFFKQNESKYLAELNVIKVQCLIGAASVYLKYRRKDLYYKKIEEIKGLKKYWNRTILKSPLKRVVLWNYYLNLIRYVVVHEI